MAGRSRVSRKKGKKSRKVRKVRKARKTRKTRRMSGKRRMVGGAPITQDIIDKFNDNETIFRHIVLISRGEDITNERAIEIVKQKLEDLANFYQANKEVIKQLIANKDAPLPPNGNANGNNANVNGNNGNNGYNANNEEAND